MIRLDVKGMAPGAEMHEETITLHDVPRVGDQLAVWLGDIEAYIKVGEVTWPTWTYEKFPDEREPEVWLNRPDEMTDDEWADVFAAMKEGRRP